MTFYRDDPMKPRQATGDQFVNRHEELDAVRRHTNAPTGQMLPVLHFYGVGGIGKTSLINKLVRELDKRVPHALLDMRSERDRDPIRALTVLRI